MLPIVITLVTDLLSELGIVYSESLNALSKSFDSVRELLRRVDGISLRS